MTNILKSLFVVVAVAAVAGGATYAYFSDTAPITDNTFASGTLDLKANDNDSVVNAYHLSSIIPGAWDLAGQVVLKNAGTVKGHLWYEITNVRNNENTCTTPEVGDTTCGGGTDQGELGQFAKASVQANVAPWTRYPLSAVPINTAAGVRYDVTDLNPGDTYPLVVYGVWTADGATDNLAQGDSVLFDIVYHLDQIP